MQSSDICSVDQYRKYRYLKNQTQGQHRTSVGKKFIHSLFFRKNILIKKQYLFYSVEVMPKNDDPYNINVGVSYRMSEADDGSEINENAQNWITYQKLLIAVEILEQDKKSIFSKIGSGIKRFFFSEKNILKEKIKFLDSLDTKKSTPSINVLKNTGVVSLKERIRNFKRNEPLLASISLEEQMQANQGSRLGSLSAIDTLQAQIAKIPNHGSPTREIQSQQGKIVHLPSGRGHLVNQQSSDRNKNTDNKKNR